MEAKAMITREQLATFCYKDDEMRPELQQPFTVGDFTYATDGRILIRVPRLDGVEKGCHDKWTACPSKYFSETLIGPVWLPVPELPAREPDRPCTKCDGKPVCAACRGDGSVEYEFWHGPTKHTLYGTCPLCDGDVQCRHCDGTLVEPRNEGDEAVEIGGALINSDFLRLLAALPNAELTPRGPLDPCRIRFDGGEGVVMPMRRGLRR